MAPLPRRPKSQGYKARARPSRGFTKPTPLRRIVALAPQPLGCAPLEAADRGAFRVPTKEQRRGALGSAGGTPFLMQRILRFAEAWFEPILQPRGQDWLSQHKELMQNFAAFRAACEDQREFIGPSAERNCIHILPLGPEEPTQTVQQAMQEALTAFFFPLRVKIIKGKPGSNTRSAASTPRGAGTPRGSTPRQVTPTGRKSSKDNALPRIQQSDPHELPAQPLVFAAANEQLQPEPEPPKQPKAMKGEEVLPWMARGVRSDSAITIGLTCSPLTYHGSLTEGATDWSGRVGIFSLADLVSDVLSPLAVERAAKLVLHQVMHMLGVLHCCYFRCLMNGAANQEEADGRPPYLCAMCLKKLHLVLGMDPLVRYQHLAHFWAWAGNPQVALWYETRVRVIHSTFSSSASAQLPPPQRHRPGSSSKGNHDVREEEDDFGDDSGATPAWWRSKPPLEGSGSSDNLQVPSPNKNSPSRRRSRSGDQEDLDRKLMSFNMSKEEEKAAQEKWDAIAKDFEENGNYNSSVSMEKRRLSARVMKVQDNDLAGLGLPPA